jgi:hypothetical protein
MKGEIAAIYGGLVAAAGAAQIPKGYNGYGYSVRASEMSSDF